MYCEKCMLIVEDSVCPECNNKKLRELREKDFVYITEKNYMWSGMLSDVLKKNNIPFTTKARLGSAMATIVGSSAESIKFFVAIEYIDKAKEIVEELFGEEGE